MRRSLLTLSFFLIVSLFSCGTVLKGGPEIVPVKSEPTGAEIWLDGNRCGRTPKTLTVQHTAKGWIVLTLPGYENHSQKLPTQLNPWTLLNVLSFWCMFMGFAIDSSAGSLTTWDEDGINVILLPKLYQTEK